MLTRVWAGFGTGLLVLALAGGTAAAQATGAKGKQTPTPPKNVSPMNPEEQKPKGPPEVGPYVRLVSPKNQTLAVRVVVNSDAPTQKTTIRDPFTGKSVDMPSVTPFEFETLAVVWPLVPSTASSELDLTAVRGELKLNDAVVSDVPQVLKGYAGGTMLARWDAGARAQQTVCRQVELRLELPMTCSRTEFDERGAAEVGWPTGPWPADAQSLMKPQLYLETWVDDQGRVRALDDKPLKEIVEAWLKDAGIGDAKGVPPVHLAKVITGRVWASVQPSGEGLSFKRTGELAGVIVQPAAETLTTGRGSEHDMAVALAAALRSTGLPTRLVAGWDVSSGGEKFLSNKKQNKLHTWVEFCLFDEAKNTVNWVPVDIGAMRMSTTKPPAISRTWRYFGTHPELDAITPFSLHMHPPTDVMSYGWPGFWGWFVTPKPPKAAEQAISFVATQTPVRPGDRNKKKKDED